MILSLHFRNGTSILIAADRWKSGCLPMPLIPGTQKTNCGNAIALWQHLADLFYIRPLPKWRMTASL